MKHNQFAIAVSLLTLLGTMMGCSTQSAASGPSGTRLALSEPSDQSMLQGDSSRVAITVVRSGFADPVHITFSNLPEGVIVNGDTIRSGDSSMDFVLVASPTARLVNRQVVTVKAEGPHMVTSQTFELTVRSKA